MHGSVNQEWRSYIEGSHGLNVLPRKYVTIRGEFRGVIIERRQDEEDGGNLETLSGLCLEVTIAVQGQKEGDQPGETGVTSEVWMDGDRDKWKVIWRSKGRSTVK